MHTATERLPGDVGAVVHAMRILRFLSVATAPVGIAAVARATGISTSTSFNILRTLSRAGFVAFRPADKTYSLGLGIAEIATGLVGISHAELIWPELNRLALNYEMLIVLWRVTGDDHLVLIDRAHSAQAVRVEMRLGMRLPSLAGAVGRCVAAALALPPGELRRRFATLRWQTAPTFDAYQAEVAQAGERGWAIDDGQLYRGLQTVAAIVQDQNRQPRFGISGITIAGQHEPVLLEQLGRDLAQVDAVCGSVAVSGPRWGGLIGGAGR
ncbi:MAG: helix-turn-helix domain-containing protein [Acetobacteraceae bacterium]